MYYHNTSRENGFLIERLGLRINQDWGKTMDAQTDIERIYGMRPVFLATSPDRFKGKGDVTIEVDAAGLDLVADIPSLYDKGGYYDDKGMWWDEDGVPLQLIDYVDEDGFISYDDMMETGTPLVKALIALTGTAACLQTVTPDRLKVLAG